MSTEQPPNWHVTVCVHQPITPTQADRLFDTLADAAHGWEPAGVDVDVSGGPCYCRQSPSGPSFGAALGAILGASGGASQAGEDQAGVDRAVRDALRHIGYDGPDADPATERDFDTAAAAAVPVTVVGARPPWQVHNGPPPTHGTAAAEPAGWDREAIDWLATYLDDNGRPGRASQLRALLADWNRLHTWRGLMSLLDQHYPPYVQLGPDSDPGPRILALTRALDAARAEVATLTAERDRLNHLVESMTATIRAVPDAHSAANLAHARAERDRLRAELATARRNAAADALLMVRQRFAERTDGDGDIDTGWWLMWLEAWAAEVRTGQRTINPQPVTTTDDLPEWERELLDRQERTIPTHPATTGTDTTTEET
jgi:hypothetical protein